MGRKNKKCGGASSSTYIKDIKEFIITRHAFSCNNLMERKYKHGSIYSRATELDPGLSMFGIVSTLLKTSKVGMDRYRSNTVFVSCLIRTWMTSILLYLPHIEHDDTLSLVISPFLKEKHLSFLTDGGNLPKDIVSQIVALVHFFNNLSILKSVLDGQSTELSAQTGSEIDTGSDTASTASMTSSISVSNQNDISKTIIKSILQKFANKIIKLLIPNKQGEYFEILIKTGVDLRVDLAHLLSLNEIFANVTVGDFYYFKSSSFRSKRGINPERNLFQLSYQLPHIDSNKQNSENMKIIFDKVMNEVDKMENDYDHQFYLLNINAAKNEALEEKARNSHGYSGVLEPDPNNDSEMIGGASTDPIFEHNINKFIEWVHLNYVDLSKIHVVTHSDCMQAFLSKINISYRLPETQYGIFFGPQDIIINRPTNNDSRVLLGIPPSESGHNIKKLNADNWKKGENGYNKKYNKPLLSPQNVWDLTFTSEFNIGMDKSVNFSLRNMTCHAGIPKPNASIFFESCEYNCDFGQSLGMNHNKTQKCSNELNPGPGFFRRVFTRKVQPPKSVNIESPKSVKDEEIKPKKRTWKDWLLRRNGGKIRKTRKIRKTIYK